MVYLMREKTSGKNKDGRHLDKLGLGRGDAGWSFE